MSLCVLLGRQGAPGRAGIRTRAVGGWCDRGADHALDRMVVRPAPHVLPTWVALALALQVHVSGWSMSAEVVQDFAEPHNFRGQRAFFICETYLGIKLKVGLWWYFLRFTLWPSELRTWFLFKESSHFYGNLIFKKNTADWGACVEV